MNDEVLAQRARQGLAGWIANLAGAAHDARWVPVGDGGALVFPSEPDRALFNSAVAPDGSRIEDFLDEVEPLYEAAGCAWTVWIDGRDERAAAVLAERGHVLDAEPPSMAGVLAEMRIPEPDERVEVSRDWSALGRVNDAAYGWDGHWERLYSALGDDAATLYFIAHEDEPVACTMAVADGDDHCAIESVATRPGHTRRGYATALVGRALHDARERGFEFTTLQATKQGYPVYERLGYRVVLPHQMWEKRPAGR